MYKTKIHPDFPHETILGTVPGMQPKLLVRQQDDGKFAAGGTTLAEVVARFELCDDLAEQLSIYSLVKRNDNPSWTIDFNVERTRSAMTEKVKSGKWSLSLAEQDWIIARVSEVLT